MTEIRETLTAIIAEQLSIKPTDIKFGSILVDDLGADTLDLIEIQLEIDERLDVSISDTDIDRVETFGALCGLVARLAGE